ncbi:MULTISPECIES: hypothetical protein [Aeromonas]|uniref:hypothetical protein n=1 Tax=Aeromonas TaxID=642 RepID=UPI000AC55C37|nr:MULTISPECIES: hypothetical protein [Aeromonas]MBS4691472.1 hypothetical protein [Aeromonas veronii bv. veronii]
MKHNSKSAMKHVELRIRGASHIKKVVVNTSAFIDEIIDNARVSYEIEGNSISSNEWDKIKKLQVIMPELTFHMASAS